MYTAFNSFYTHGGIQKNGGGGNPKISELVKSFIVLLGRERERDVFEMSPLRICIVERFLELTLRGLSSRFRKICLLLWKF